MSDVAFGLSLFGFLMTTVLVINYFSKRVDIDKVSQHKKNRYLTWFWYFYGAFFLINGLFDIFSENDLFFGLLWVAISITFLVLNYMGKVVPKSTS